MKIPLTQGQFAIIDDEDYEKVKPHKWRANYCKGISNYYVQNCGWGVPTIMMHRLIMNAPKGLVVDHINHNTLDNRKSNLRVCTQSENLRNRRDYRDKKEPTGIVKRQKKNGVCFQILYHDRALKKTRYEGTFPTVELAVKRMKELNITLA